MKPVSRFALALFASVLALAAWTGDAHAQRAGIKLVRIEISPPHTVVVRDLVGLTPAQVQQRLTGLDADWPRTTGLEIQTSQGLLSFAALHDYLRDPAAMERGARFRSRADFGSKAPSVWSACDVAETPDTALLMFRDGRLESVWSLRNEGADAVADALPFEDGDAFLAHWGRTPIDADTRLTIRCTRHEAVVDHAAPLRSGRAGLSESDMQGLALLPFAPALPILNARRDARRRKGSALYEQLAPGYRLPENARAFAAAHGEIRAIQGRGPDYVVLKVDLGAYPGRNLSNSDDYGLVGVRGGVVAWRALDYSPAAPRLPEAARR